MRALPLETVETYTYATFWQRLCANTIDLVILLGLWWVWVSLAALSGRAWILSYLLGISSSAAYNVVMHGRYGQTLGKMLLKIYVRRPDGQPIGWSNAALRSSVDLLEAAILSTAVVIAWQTDGIHTPATAMQLMAAVAAVPLVAPLRRFSDIWFWSELATMLLNKKRRALHDFLGRTVVLRRVGGQPVPGIGTLFKRLVIGTTNQTWKLGGGLVMLLLGFTAMVFGLRHLDARYAFELTLGGIAAGLGAGAASCLMIRCPSCRMRWLWSAVKTQPASRWVNWLAAQRVCPRCGHQPQPST